MAKLTIIVGEDIGTSFELKKKSFIGRASEVDCVLKDLRASRKHSCVVCENNEYFVLDMGSHNGTYLNGVKIAGKTKLNESDKIGIGAHVLAFVSDTKETKEDNSFFGYTIINEVKKSDTGDFCIARQKILERDVLLWRISRHVLSQESEAESKRIQQDFLKQIQSIATLSHRNILILLDFGISAEYLYCAFECVNLEYNIRTHLQEEKQIDIAKNLDIIIQIATGLEYAYQQNIPHLHLTDKNILIQNDRVILTEFGVSRFLSSATATSGHGTTTGIMGVSLYISPEQASGKSTVTAKADIYSLGCIIYHFVAGRPPFQANNMYELCNSHINEEPTAIEKIKADIPKSLSILIKKCMEKNPDERPELATVMQELIQIKQTLMYEKSIYSQEGKQYLKDKFGEIKLKRWWFLGPMLSSTVIVIAFFIIRFLQN